jgi:hypothetical protein
MAARDLILHNFWWKLLSVLLSILTWITIDASLRKDRQQTPVITTSRRNFPAVKVTLMTAPYNTNEFRVNPASVSVEVSGKADDLQKLQAQQIVAFVDATKIEDEKEVRRDIEVQAPRDVQIEHVEPGSASVERLTTAR